MGCFALTIEELGKRFFTPAEFPALPRERFPESVLSSAAALPPDRLAAFAFRLRGAELEGLLLDLADERDERRLETAAEILKLRCSPRLGRLMSMLCQFYYRSTGLYRVTSLLLSAGKAPDEFLRRFGGAEDRVAAFAEAVRDEYESIGQLCRECGILEQSPFAREGALRYLSGCGKQGLLSNTRWIAALIAEMPAVRLRPLIMNDLSTLSLVEQNDGVNLAILKRLGTPAESMDWAEYPRELRDGFAQWHSLHRLKLHLGFQSPKFSVLGRYFSHVRAITETDFPDAGHLLCADFGDFVVTDLAGSPVSSYCRKSFYEDGMRAFHETDRLPVFTRDYASSVTARDFIIENKDAPCITLEFEGVDLFYISEMLDILLGLEPDMRKKRSRGS